MKAFKKGIAILEEKGLNPEYSLFSDSGINCINQREFFVTCRGEKVEVIYENGYLEPRFSPDEKRFFHTWEGEKIEIDLGSQMYSSEKTKYREWFSFEWEDLAGKILISTRNIDIKTSDNPEKHTKEQLRNMFVEVRSFGEYRPYTEEEIERILNEDFQKFLKENDISKIEKKDPNRIFFPKERLETDGDKKEKMESVHVQDATWAICDDTMYIGRHHEGISETT